jgi:hypothetical protein
MNDDLIGGLSNGEMEHLLRMTIDEEENDEL